MSPSISTRFVALDIHKHYAVIAAVDEHAQIVLKPRRVSFDRLPQWAQQHLHPSDQVVIEATTNAWHVYDMLAPFVAQVKVANPIRIAQIAQARVKTDAKDALILARLLAANLIPEVWVPPEHVRDLRRLVSQRHKLVKMHTQVVNRLHSVSHRHHLGHPKGKRFHKERLSWLDALPDTERWQVELDLETKDHLEAQIQRLTDRLATLSQQEPWASQALLLMQLPGFGIVTTMTVLAAIGDITRFPSPKHLVSYAGLAPGIHQSGVKERPKPITKEGRKDLRWAMVEIAWRAVRSHPLWQRRFQELTRRKHPNDAVVVIAHRLLVIVWHLLTKGVPYRHSTPERIAHKFLTWGYRLNEEQRRGMTRAQFARYCLMRLGIGDDLQRVALYPKYPRKLAPPEEVRPWLEEAS